MHIYTLPSETLRAQCTPVVTFDVHLRRIIDEMTLAMYESNGVGLAAPQVGRSDRIVIVDPSSGERSKDFIAMINPRISWRSEQVTVETEGCLSIPGVTVPVERHQFVKVEFSDVAGVQRSLLMKNLWARIAQHEIDHLDGILMIDRAPHSALTGAYKNLSKTVLELPWQVQTNCLVQT